MKRSWKTTVCGLVALIGGSLTQFFPEYAKLGGFLATVGSGAGLLFARDFDKSKTPKPKGPRIFVSAIANSPNPKSRRGATIRASIKPPPRVETRISPRAEREAGRPKSASRA